MTPLRYAISLRVDPAQPRFSGTTVIQVEVPAPAAHVVLHARDMTVTLATARTAQGAIAATTTLRTAHDGAVPEELVLTFAHPLPAGTAQLELTYDAPFASDLAGLYRVEEGGRWYAFTQFESTDARRAFPCFDEPGFKTPFDVTLVTPRGAVALANAPEGAHDDAEPGWTTHRFDTSRPLPSYLVAFAVGEFDLVQGQTAPFPIRIVTTKGNGALTGLALEAATALVAKLGDYFDVRYPYPKLDLLAVPDFAAGAMENPGLLTFRDELLLLDPKNASTAVVRDQAGTIAHELAHQWFGDLVTPQWWDDLWLNEGFATWAEAKMVDAWKPHFQARREQLAEIHAVMSTDALHTARAIREPVRSSSDAMESFDGLTYVKGAAVLRMLEGWLGPDTFRRGVQRYLHDHAWKSARASDLFDALDFVSAQKVGDLASGFLDHPGVPAVTVGWKCDGHGTQVSLAQSEWRPLGSAAQPPRSWTLPVCLTTDAPRSRSCLTLGSTPLQRDLGARCPAWLYPNADEGGYYRFVVDRAQLLALVRSARSLDPTSRFGLLANTWGQVQQGTLDPADLLGALPAFDGDTDRLVIQEVTDLLEELGRTLVTDDDRTAFRRYVAARLGARKAALGWEAPKGVKEDDDRILTRRLVLRTLGDVGRDERTLAEADAIARRWLADPQSVPADTASIAVRLASIRAGESRLDELRTAARTAKRPDDRVLALQAMGWFDDPAVLGKVFELAMTDEVKLSELAYMLGPVMRQPASALTLYGWEKQNWAKVTGRLDTFGKQVSVEVAGAMCARTDADDARAFFETATQGMEGVHRGLEEGLERADLCAALREHGAQDTAAFLARKR